MNFFANIEGVISEMRLTSEIRNNWHQTERPTVDTSDLLTDLEGLKNISQLSSWPRATTISVSKF